MRWSYAEMIVAQSKLNPLTSRQERSQREIDSIVATHREDVDEGKRLDELKVVLACSVCSIGSCAGSSKCDEPRFCHLERSEKSLTDSLITLTSLCDPGSDWEISRLRSG